MKRKINLTTSVGVTALCCAVTFSATVFFMQYHFRHTMEKYQRLSALDSYVQKHFYTDPDAEKLMDSTLKGYVQGLDDRYSQYLTADEYSALMTKEAGKTVGIGITVTRNEDGYLHIISVQKNSPAESAGLEPDDILIAVEGEDIAGMEFDESISRITGEENTSVMLTVRHSDSTEEEVSIIRQEFDIATVSFQMLAQQTGYIRITNFRENTAAQFQEALDALLAQDAKGIIFDVRSNGGGLLSSLEKMLDPLLPEGVIATATYHGGVTEEIVSSDANELNLPMAVLVNGNTASAAELFSASLRDFKQVKLVGTQTFGKGIMQVTTRMADGGGLTLTVATYQTSVSECYHGVGLTPDIVIESAEGFSLTDTPDPEQDIQLSAAMELFS